MRTRIHAAYDREHGHAVLAGARPDATGVRAVPRRVRRQGQPCPPVLGRARSRRHPVLRSPRAAASRRRTELRAARDARGLLARGQQRRLLAGPRRRRRLLLVRLSRSPTATGRLPGRLAPRPGSTRHWASSCCPTRPSAQRPILTPYCSTSFGPRMRPPPTLPPGIATPSSDEHQNRASGDARCVRCGAFDDTGRIASGHTSFDRASLMAQLGVTDARGCGGAKSPCARWPASRPPPCPIPPRWGPSSPGGHYVPLAVRRPARRPPWPVAWSAAPGGQGSAASKPRSADG